MNLQTNSTLIILSSSSSTLNLLTALNHNEDDQFQHPPNLNLTSIDLKSDKQTLHHLSSHGLILTSSSHSQHHDHHLINFKLSRLSTSHIHPSHSKSLIKTSNLQTYLNFNLTLPHQPDHSTGLPFTISAIASHPRLFVLASGSQLILQSIPRNLSGSSHSHLKPHQLINLSDHLPHPIHHLAITLNANLIIFSSINHHVSIYNRTTATYQSLSIRSRSVSESHHLSRDTRFWF